MSRIALSSEAKATMRANLELEVSTRKEKLLSMCEAQCASLRSRLERRVNRVPNNKRTTKVIDLLEPLAPQKQVPTKKEKEATPAATLNNRRTRPATATAAPAPPPKPASKLTRGVKRTSDEISAEDKENNAELAVPKKRTKAAPATTRATRTTRAASKKTDATPQILSPKTNNARPVPQTRTRRQR